MVALHSIVHHDAAPVAQVRHVERALVRQVNHDLHQFYPNAKKIVFRADGKIDFLIDTDFLHAFEPTGNVTRLGGRPSSAVIRALVTPWRPWSVAASSALIDFATGKRGLAGGLCRRPYRIYGVKVCDFRTPRSSGRRDFLRRL